MEKKRRRKVWLNSPHKPAFLEPTTPLQRVKQLHGVKGPKIITAHTPAQEGIQPECGFPGIRMALGVPCTHSHAVHKSSSSHAWGGWEGLSGSCLAHRHSAASGAGVRTNFSLYLRLLALLLPQQGQYDLLNLFLFPSGSSSAVCVGKINCLIIALISNQVTFSVAV